MGSRPMTIENTTNTLLTLDDFPDANWLEDGRCAECGTAISRYWIHGEESAWFDDDAVEHDDSVCPTLEDENDEE